MSLPTFGHLEADRSIKVGEPIGRATYIERGRHLIIGQRGSRGSTGGLIYLGKCIEHSRIQDKYDSNVWVDVAFPHVVFVSGTRGSGKSFDIGVVVEGLLLPSSTKVSTGHPTVAVIVFDPQNQFWTLSRKPDGDLEEDAAHLQALRAWSLEPAAINNVRLYLPPGEPRLLGTEETLVLATADLTADDLCSFWNTDVYSPQGHLIATAIEKVAQRKPAASQDGSQPTTDTTDTAYEIEDLIRFIETDPDVQRTINSQVIDAVRWRLESLRRSGLFSAAGMPVRELLSTGYAAVLLVRGLDDATKALVAGILVKKVYTSMGEYHARRKIRRRLGQDSTGELALPERVWCILDEAHVVCPASRETGATRSVIEYVKRGRDAGLSLLLATQQPSAIDDRVLSQVDLALVHRLTFDSDIGAAVARIPAYLPQTFTLGSSEKPPRALVRLLESGEAIVGDSQTDRAFVTLVRPRLTAHGGAEPK